MCVLMISMPYLPTAAPISAPVGSVGYAADAITTGIFIAGCSGGMASCPTPTTGASGFGSFWHRIVSRQANIRLQPTAADAILSRRG